jgi:hypothetical protein
MPNWVAESKKGKNLGNAEFAGVAEAEVRFGFGKHP